MDKTQKELIIANIKKQLPKPTLAGEYTFKGKSFVLQYFDSKNLSKDKIIEEAFEKVTFSILKIFVKPTFRHRLTGNPEDPISGYPILDLLYFFDKGVERTKGKPYFDKQKFLTRLQKWESERLPADTINEQLLGFQILQGNAITYWENNDTLNYICLSKKALSKVYLRVPGSHAKKTKAEKMHPKHYHAYIRNDKDPCFRDDRFLYDSRKFVITQSLFKEIKQSLAA